MWKYIDLHIHDGDLVSTDDLVATDISRYLCRVA